MSLLSNGKCSFVHAVHTVLPEQSVNMALSLKQVQTDERGFVLLPFQVAQI